MTIKIKRTIKFSVFSFFLFFAFPIMASTLYLDPVEKKINTGDDFIVKVKIGTPSECVNTFDIGIEFPLNKFKYKDFSSGNSILSLWIEKPNSLVAGEINNTGKVNFSGGIPGGYCGSIPGDDGESNILGEIVFSALDEFDKGIAEIKIDKNSKILANDGLGSIVDFDFKDSRFIIDSEVNNNNEWSDKIKEDNIPPEPFLVKINQDESVDGGNFFLVFSTVDKQTGIDRYEVLELNKIELDKYYKKLNIFDKFLSLFVKESKREWNIIQSPYILKDQSLNSVVMVRAIDKAGNYRESTYDNGIYDGIDNGGYFFNLVVVAIFILLSIIVTVRVCC